MRRTSPNGRHWTLMVLAPLALLLFGGDAGQAQLKPPPSPSAPTTTRPRDADDDSAKDPSESLFPGGAALKTDPEQQRLLKRADLCVADGRLDLAAVLWQKVLDEAGDTLMLQHSQSSPVPVAIYTSLAQQVERTLAKLPPLALATYRTSADAEAQALLAAAGPSGEEDALAAVVRRYFLSSVGDDAAYKLACLALDRYDFVGASRLLNKILDSHPDPSIPRSELLLRLAVASARMGDRQSAEQALTKLTSAGGPRPSSDVVDLIVADVRSAAATSGVGPAAKDWHMALGNPGRTGFMPALPEAVTSRTLSELWVREDPLALATLPGQQQYFGGGAFMGGVVVMRGGMAMSQGGQVQQQAPVSREDLITNWRAGGWKPAGRLLFDGGRVYLKTPDRLVCYSSVAHSQQPVWQSAWENRFELDSMSQMLAQMAMAYGYMPQQASSTRPKSPAEVLLFADRVHQSMAIDGGVIYTLEGKRVGAESRPAQMAARGFQYGVTPRRSRGNWLTAYQATGGKALWTRSASDEDKEGSTDIGFLAAPTPCGSLLLAPITDGGTIWLLGLERGTGKTLWRSYLCDEPQGGASPWSEVQIAVEGREAYLTCGCGVLFAVDAVGGTIRWAVRYQRDGQPNVTMRNYGYGQSMLDLSGWDDDVVIPHGQYLIVMSSDCDQLLAVDRRTGSFFWNSPRTSPFGSVANYCLGVQGGRLFVGGKNVVRCYDLKGQGKLAWEKSIEDSFGRGCVTEDAIYVPVKDSILKLDPQKGRELAQVGVALTSDEPVGNLFSDGEKLWVVGAGRVYAMTTLEHRMKMLEEQIAAGDGEAQLNRMRLHFKQNRAELALADLRGAYVLFQARETPDEAALRLFAAVNEMKLTQKQPLVALQLLTELFVTATALPQLTKDALGRRADLVASAVSVIRQEKTRGALAPLLAVAPLLTEEYLLSAAMFAVDGVATKDDAPALLEALKNGTPVAQLLSIRALTRLVPDDAKAPLAERLPAGDDRVRLAAARALANLGERKDVLETFVALMESESPRVRNRSHQSLRSLTGQQVTFVPEGKAEDRAAAIAQWKQWLAASGATAKLNLPLSDQAVPLGRTLFVSQGQGLAVELDSDNKERWRQNLPGPAWGCQGLPNGHRLIAVYSHSMVVEYDDSGKEVWKKDRLPGPPYTVQRLDNGNTLVACADVNQLVEISPDGTTTIVNVPGRPMSAQRLESGNTLVALQQGNRVVEVDRTGKIVWEARTSNPPGHAVRLDNGNTLVALTYGRQIVEFDPTGKTIVWKTSVALTNPYAAQRLPSGNTLVADHQGIHEIEASGQKVRRMFRQQQVTGLSSY